jgi:hypothetical protein
MAQKRGRPQFGMRQRSRQRSSNLRRSRWLFSWGYGAQRFSYTIRKRAPRNVPSSNRLWPRIFSPLLGSSPMYTTEKSFDLGGGGAKPGWYLITHRLPNVNHTQRTPLKCMILNFYFDKIEFSIRNLKDIIIVLKRIFFVFVLTNGFTSINFMGLNYGRRFTLWEFFSK